MSLNTLMANKILHQFLDQLTTQANVNKAAPY